MQARGYWLVLCLAIALAGCGRQQSAQPANPAAPTGSVAPGPAAPVAAKQHNAAPADADQPAKITRLNEDGSETVEETTSDSGAHNPLLAAVASTVAAATPTASAASLSGPTLWQDGVNYTRLVPTQPTAVAAGQVEVLEFFWYACPHCYSLDPMVEAWLKNKPPYVSFSRVHVMWSDGYRNLAHLFYTLDSLNKLSALHTEVFNEIHVNGNPLIGSDPGNAAQAEQVQTAFAVKHGISAADFKAAYHSMGVETKMQRADELVQRYRVSGVPTFVVNGKYVADVGTAGSPERLISLVGDLAASEHKH